MPGSNRMAQVKTKSAIKFLISGEVQGVGYRFFAQRAAAKHQIVGYARNLDDGSVEVYAEGTRGDLDDFEHDLAAGPRYAQVENIEKIVLDTSDTYSSFLIEK
ncbi:MAG: acylphosphatase [Pyrinomonadaceae bacterium]